MKKQKQKLLVLRELTQSDIESIGLNKMVSKTWWILAVLFAGTIGTLLGLIATFENQTDLISRVILTVFGICAIIYYACVWYFGGRKLWNEVKDKEQPIKID